MSRRVKVVVAVIVIGIAFALLRSYPAGSATGEIVSVGGLRGDFIVRPVTCFTDMYFGFSSLWVAPESFSRDGRSGFQGGLEIVKRDDGSLEAYVEHPKACRLFQCEQHRVDPEHCQVFELSVSAADQWLRTQGRARLICETPAGESLRVDLTFERCGPHPPLHGPAVTNDLPPASRPYRQRRLPPLDRGQWQGGESPHPAMRSGPFSSLTPTTSSVGEPPARWAVISKQVEPPAAPYPARDDRTSTRALSASAANDPSSLGPGVAGLPSRSAAT
jgi:hypothetical protein